MTVGERIKHLCKEKGITVKKLETDLGYGNGSLATSTDKIQSNRALEIADYLGVTINYLLVGHEIPQLQNSPASKDVELLEKFHALNDSNQKVVISMIETMLLNQ